MSKLLFMDIDGTLYDHGEQNGIPASAKLAVTKARNNGHKVYVCTGRVRSAVSQDMLDVGFDGAIYAAGADVEIDHQRLFVHRLAPELLRKTIKILKELEVGFTLEGEHGSYIDKIAKERFHKMFKMRLGFGTNSELAATFLREHNMSSYLDINLDEEPINKISFFAQSAEAIEELKKLLHEDYSILVHGEKDMDYINGECIASHLSKATGMDHILEYTQSQLADTMAYGDSLNDYEMILHANVGVCMGNGRDIVKEIADDVCDNIEDDAIYKSFIKYGLIMED